MPLINFEINIDVYWSDKCNTVATGVTNQRATFSITDTKLYVPVVTLSIQDNPKLLEQLNYGFKRKINWNKYQSKISTSRRNKYFDYWINPSFQRINIPFVLSFEGEVKRTNFKRYYVLTVEIKNYVMIDGKNWIRSRKWLCNMHYNYFLIYYDITGRDLRNSALDVDPKPMQ